ncbi:MAG: DUF2069 domain-containing protein [Gammaproteobacteria bacterium]
MTGAPDSQHPSRWIAIAALAAIIALLLYPAPTTWSVAISLPLLVLIAAGIRPAPKWGGWVAALVIPYFAGALGEAIASPAGRTENWSITVLTIVTFLAAFYFVRRSGASLRR